MNREELANYVGRLISKDREEQHGDAVTQFMCQQELWEVLIKYGVSELDPVARHALQMDTTKTSRIVCGRNLQDHWLDKAGYALIAAEEAEMPLPESKVATIKKKVK